jgi:hypothetical protein
VAQVAGNSSLGSCLIALLTIIRQATPDTNTNPAPLCPLILLITPVIALPAELAREIWETIYPSTRINVIGVPLAPEIVTQMGATESGVLDTSDSAREPNGLSACQ